MIGYTLSTVEKNKMANPKQVGVKIGKQCIKKNISVREIAKIAGVSTVTVYGWFTGQFNPREETAAKIQKYLQTR